eukprot:gene857-1665_t
MLPSNHNLNYQRPAWLKWFIISAAVVLTIHLSSFELTWKTWKTLPLLKISSTDFDNSELTNNNIPQERELDLFVNTKLTEHFTLVIGKAVFPGHVKPLITVNGSSPGPILRVTLGNWVRVRVVNELHEPTTVHFHGMTQRGTPYSDGVTGFTQCPIGAHQYMEYVFKPESAGTFWYHGHASLQTLDGLQGAFIVEREDEKEFFQNVGASYSTDDAVLMVQDYYNKPAREYLDWYLSPESGGDEPIPDNYTVNHLFSGGSFNMAVSRNGGPSRFRIVNSAGFSMFSVHIDGLPLRVIELDGVAVRPLALSSVILNVAQRVSFLVDWTDLQSSVSLKNSPSIWIRVVAMHEMYPTYDPSAEHYGIFGTDSGKPVNSTWKGLISFIGEGGGRPTYLDSEVPVLTQPAPKEFNILQGRPIIRKKAPLPDYFLYFEVVFAEDANGINRANVNGRSFSMSGMSSSSNLLRQIEDSAVSFTPTIRGKNIIGDAMTPFVLPYNKTVDILINNTDGGEHPFHLHGHTFWIVSTSEMTNANYYKDNYPRRDVVSIPAGGWARIRIITSNPGVWLLHCHIDWHVEAGLVSTLIVAPELLVGGQSYTEPRPVSMDKACPAPPPGPKPTRKPTLKPSRNPSKRPSLRPVPTRSVTPTRKPSKAPSRKPSKIPTYTPSRFPSKIPSRKPSRIPSRVPSKRPVS